MKHRNNLKLTADNRRINLREYRTGSTFLHSRPRYVMVELTRGCNLACKMCRKERVPFIGNNMRLPLFRKISRDLFPTAELIDLRGWGESLLLPQFGDFLEIAVQQSSANIRIITNLSFQCDDILKMIADANCYVGVSIDSAISKVLSEIRTGADLHLIKDNLKKLVGFYINKWRSSERISICCTVQQIGLSSLEYIADLSKECGIKNIMLSSVTSELPADYCLYGISDKVDSALSRLKYRANINGIKAYATTKMGELEMPDNHPAFECVRPWCFATISYSGHVGFCDHLIGPLTDEFSLGDYNVNSFDDIWNNQKWRDLRYEHNYPQSFNLNCSKKCSDCYQNRYVDFEYLLFPELSKRRMVICQ